MQRFCTTRRLAKPSRRELFKQASPPPSHAPLRCTCSVASAIVEASPLETRTGVIAHREPPIQRYPSVALGIFSRSSLSISCSIRWRATLPARAQSRQSRPEPDRDFEFILVNHDLINYEANGPRLFWVAHLYGPKVGGLLLCSACDMSR